MMSIQSRVVLSLLFGTLAQAQLPDVLSFGGLAFDVATMQTSCPTEYQGYVGCLLTSCPDFQGVCPNLIGDAAAESASAPTERPTCQDIHDFSCNSAMGNDCCMQDCLSETHALVACLQGAAFGVELATCQPEACDFSSAFAPNMEGNAIDQVLPEKPDINVCIRSETEGWLSYEPLVVECPAVGEYVVATFGYRVPQPVNLPVFLQDPPRFAQAVAASHSGGTGGITLLHKYSTACNTPSCNVTQELEDILWINGTLDNSFCPAHLVAGRLCETETSLPYFKARDLHTVVVFNDGGCEGNLTIEASIQDALEEDFETMEEWFPATCFSPLLPLLFPDDNSTIIEANYEESLCEYDEQEGIKYFSTITIPCPEAGKRVGANFIFRQVTLPGRFLPFPNFVDSKYAVAVSHDDLTDPTSGILLQYAYPVESCEELLEETIEADGIFNGEVNNCFGNLQSPDKVCADRFALEQSGELVQVDYIILNLGGCVGNLTLEAALLSPPDLEEGAVGAVCLVDTLEVCRDEFDGAEALALPLAEPEEDASDLPPAEPEENANDIDEDTDENDLLTAEPDENVNDMDEDTDFCPELVNGAEEDGVSCTCERDVVTNGYSVRCEHCLRCDPTGEVCANHVFYAEFTEDLELPQTDNIGGLAATYTSGRSDELLFTISNVGNTQACTMEVNGNGCDMCEFRNCSLGWIVGETFRRGCGN